MKSTARMLACYCILLLALVCGCAGEPDNVAVSADGVEISFETSGEGKPGLIFVHGWSNNRSIWDAQVAHFSEKYKVITVDLAGFGESGHNRTSWTMSSYGDDVAAVIAKLDIDEVVLVGFSMGAIAVIEAAMLAPDQILGLVIVDELQNVDERYPPQLISVMDSVFMDIVTSPSLEKMKPFFRNNVDKSFARILAMLDGASRIGWRESINDLFRWRNEDCARSLTEIEAPIIAINSDRKISNVEAFKALAPSFETKIIPGVGHLVMWDAPEEFNRLLEESIQQIMNKSK